MTWELYEVWTEDDIGHQELVDTTKSLKEARVLAQKSLEDYPVAVIYKETEDGDTEEVERLTFG
jgi:ClpP class serine protease